MGLASRRIAIYALFAFVVLSSLVDETEGRRKILRGRKTITRTYYKPLLIPAWAVVLLVAISMILFGVGLFFIVHRTVLGRSDDDRDYP